MINLKEVKEKWRRTKMREAYELGYAESVIDRIAVCKDENAAISILIEARHNDLYRKPWR